MRLLRSPLMRIVTALSYSLVAAELYLRIFAPVPLLPRYVVATPHGIRGNQPNAVYYHTTPECYVRMETNSRGIRTHREIPYKKPTGVKRVVVLGDSFGMGYEVSQEEMFLTRLEEFLDRAGARFEVVNLSVSGFGNAEELIALRAEGVKYEPDLVLVCWHSSDLEDNVRSALYALEGDRLIRSQPSYLPGTGTQEMLAGYRLYRWLSERCQLYSFIREETAGRVKEFLSRLRGSGSGSNDHDTARSKEPTPDRQESVAARPISMQDRLTVALLREIQAEANAHGAQLLVLDIPDYGLVNRLIGSSFPRDPEGKDFGLRVVRPLERFHRVPDDQLLYRRHGHHHLTPLGCRIVGELLAEAIRRL